MFRATFATGRLSFEHNLEPKDKGAVPGGLGGVLGGLCSACAPSSHYHVPTTLGSRHRREVLSQDFSDGVKAPVFLKIQPQSFGTQLVLRTTAL